MIQYHLENRIVGIAHDGLDYLALVWDRPYLNFIRFDGTTLYSIELSQGHLETCISGTSKGAIITVYSSNLLFYNFSTNQGTITALSNKRRFVRRRYYSLLVAFKGKTLSGFCGRVLAKGRSIFNLVFEDGYIDKIGKPSIKQIIIFNRQTREIVFNGMLDIVPHMLWIAPDEMTFAVTDKNRTIQVFDI